MSERPITVVSGLPRSGTSLMMQMLAAAGIEPLVDDHWPADDSNPRGYYELDAVKRTRTDASWVDGAEGRAVKVIHALLGDLPRDRRYRVLFMRRRIDEVLDSQDRMLERLDRPAASLPRERLAAVFEKQVDDALALLASEPCFDVLEVEHARLLADPAGTAREVAAYLGVESAASDMAACVDASLHRERGG